ncbi:retrotransposon-related protein [Tanacetum coccineum]
MDCPLRWMTRNFFITTWSRFEESVKNCFGPSKYEDPHGALLKLLQLGTVEDYQREFEKLMNRVTDIPDSLLISFYISGLKLNLQRELLVSKPTTLGDAFSLARITKARLEDQSAPASVTTAKPFSNVGNQRQSTPRLGGTSPAVSTPKSPLLPNPNTNPKPLAIKWISPAECQERLNKGLCFNCDNRWVRGHKCPGKFFLLMTDEDDDPGDATIDGGDDAVESGDISILNSLIGHGSPRFLQLWGMIGTMNVHVLIDNGDASLRMKKISLYQMQALLDLDEVYAVYEIHSLAKASALENTELMPLLERFDSLFQVPTTLPPHRLIDHRIHLLPDTKSVNVRPYRYPHYQKGKMEKLVTEMLDQGILRYSQSPFSSPVLLVKKKDGSYQFCVDYRALNAVTVQDKFPIPTADEMFDELGGAIIFTKLDLRAGYHQIRVHELDVYKAVF